MKNDRTNGKIRYFSTNLREKIASPRQLITAVISISLVFMGGCKHTSANPSYEAGRDLGKNSYTPRMQKDVRELINLVQKPL